MTCTVVFCTWLLKQIGWQTYLPFRESPLDQPACKSSQGITVTGFYTSRPFAHQPEWTAANSRFFKSTGAAPAAYEQVSKLCATPEEKIICLSLTWKPDSIPERLAELGPQRRPPDFPGRTSNQIKTQESFIAHQPFQFESSKPSSLWCRYHRTYLPARGR